MPIRLTLEPALPMSDNLFTQGPNAPAGVFWDVVAFGGTVDRAAQGLRHP